MKYSISDGRIFVDGEPVAQIDVLPGELNAARLADLISAANLAVRRRPAPSSETVPTIPDAVNDIDETGAGGFLAAHHVPIISPEIGMELIKIVRRIETVEKVYPLPSTVDVYRL